MMVLLFLGVFINQVKNQVLANLSFQNSITKTRLLDTELTSYFSKIYNFYNYDLINRSQKEFAQHLQSIQKHLASEILLNKNEIFASLEIIEDKFQEKKRYLDKFKAYNAILNNSYRYLSVLHEAILQRGESTRVQDRVLLAKTFTKIMELNLQKKSKEELFKAIHQLEKVHSQDPTYKELIEDFLTHAHIVMSYDEKLKEIKLGVEGLQMDQALKKFAQLTDSYFRIIINIATAITIFMISLVIIFSFLIWKFYTKQINDKKDLRRFKRSVEESDNIVIITDLNNKVTYVNDTFEKITGYTKQEILGHDPKIMSSGLHTKEFYTELKSSLNRGKKWSGEFINKKKDGTLFYEKTTITPILDDNGEADSFIAIKLDVTKDKEYQKRIEEKNREITDRYYTDSLTNIQNTNRLLEDLEENNIGLLLLVNIDNFNELRFFYGIEASEDLLIQTGELLRSITHTIEGSSLYKLDKDEYCIWSENLGLLTDIESLLEEIHEKIVKHPFYINSQEIFITATLGVSYYYFTEQTNVNDLIIHGDLAHRYAKQHKLPYAVFKPEDNMEGFYRENIIWTQKTTEALKEGRVTTFFQPIVDKEEKIIAYETLVRIIDNDGSIISPFKFLDIAKKSNQYTKITKVVIEKAFETFKESKYRFSVNIDFEDINSKEVRELLRSKLSQCKKPHNFTAEILESDSISNYEKVEEFIKELKSFGCKVAIDDFGSGYSNFERVAKLDVDYIKIDGSIIKNIHSNESMRKIAESIVHFAKNIDKEVIGEFVSSQEVFNASKALDIDYFQGYYFSEPKERI